MRGPPVIDYTLNQSSNKANIVRRSKNCYAMRTLGSGVGGETVLLKTRKTIREPVKPKAFYQESGTPFVDTHRNEPFRFLYGRPNRRALAFICLAGPWMDILSRGRVVCIDELETSMHPHMVRELLRLFFDPSVNTGGAQVIFTTHNPLLLDTTLLRRDQVWFTDKDAKGAAHLYPLTDYSPRKGESLIRGYLSGRYGALPFIPAGLLDTAPSHEREEGSHG